MVKSQKLVIILLATFSIKFIASLKYMCKLQLQIKLESIKSKEHYLLKVVECKKKKKKHASYIYI